MKYYTRFIIIIFAIFIFYSCKQDSEPADKEFQKPNIIFILTDDLGYGDLGVLFQNQRAEKDEPFHKTPNLDRMANEGISLTRHFVPAPVCAPSRASLLQGVHQGHAGIRNNQFDKALSANHNLATVLKEAGYITGLVGKYGLQGLEGDSPETWEAYPTKRGFDHFFGYVRHRDGHNHYPAHEAPDRPPVELYDGNEEISSRLKGCYTTDLFTAAAKKWIIDNANTQSDTPFFLYLAFDTPHAGLQVASTPYPDGRGLDGGIQWIGDDGNFINTAEEPVDDYIHPDYAGQPWPDQQKRFASMVRRIDNSIEDIRQLLIDLNIDKETLIVFTSDNGPHRESYGYGEYDPTFFDSFGPLDGIKRDTWEGGIRVPLLAYWPGRIPAGAVEDTPTAFHDWLPTFAQMAGLPAPARSDGISLLPLLTGKEMKKKSTVYIEYSEGRATPEYSEFHPSHQGQLRRQMQVTYLNGFKGVRYNIQSWEDDFRIYDTRNDPGETNDLAGTNDHFITLQQQMKNEVLRLRRPDSSAVRPYDNIPIPADSLTNLEHGLEYKVFDITTPWVPDISTINQKPVNTGVCDGFDLDVSDVRGDMVTAFSGILEAPETGEYTFSLQMDGRAIFRLHRSAVIDADKLYVPGSVERVNVHLEKGFHPVNLTFNNREEGLPSLQLQWSGPGFGLQAIDPGLLFHKAPGKPVESAY